MRDGWALYDVEYDGHVFHASMPVKHFEEARRYVPSNADNFNQTRSRDYITTRVKQRLAKEGHEYNWIDFEWLTITPHTLSILCKLNIKKARKAAREAQLRAELQQSSTLF